MNKFEIVLESSSTAYQLTLDETLIDDHTEVSFNISNIYSNVLPLYLKIDWGDGNSEIHENDIYTLSKKDVNVLTYNPIFGKSYNHQYYPSDSSLYKCLTAQLLIHYSNGENNWFIIPFKIRTYDYFESIYDLDLYSTDIIPTYPQKIKYSFIENKNGYLVDMQ